MWRKKKENKGEKKNWYIGSCENKVYKNGSKKKFSLKILLPAFLVLLVSVFLLGTLYNHLSDPGRVRPSPIDEGEDRDFEVIFDEDVINVLFLGFDSSLSREQNYEVFRPDTIMVASINLEERGVNLVSIPRDSYVKIAGTGGHDKINHAYYYGYDNIADVEGDTKHRRGLETQVRTVSNFLGGVHIDYFVAVDMDGVVEIVDHIGGVEHEVEMYIEPHILGDDPVEPGHQVLDGSDVLNYVRHRDRETRGDFGRVQRQQKLIEAILEQFLDTMTLGNIHDKIPAIYKSVSSNVETSMSIEEILSMALFTYKELDINSMETYVFPGEEKRGGVHNLLYVVIYEDRRVEIIKEAFGAEVERRSTITPPPYEGEEGEEEEEEEEEPVEEENEEQNGEAAEEETSEMNEEEMEESEGAGEAEEKGVFYGEEESERGDGEAASKEEVINPTEGEIEASEIT